MMFSCTTCLLKRRRAFSTVSPSWSLTSAKQHPHPAPIFQVALYGHFRRRSLLALGQFFRQFLAGLEARIPFCVLSARLRNSRRSSEMLAASGAAAQFEARVDALASLRERDFFWSLWFTWAGENVSGSNGPRHRSMLSCSSCSGSSSTARYSSYPGVPPTSSGGVRR